MASHRRERLAAGLARLVVRLRLLVVAGWIAGAVVTTLALPGLGSGDPLALGGLVPRDSEAIEAGEREARLFSVPLTTDTVVVQRDAGGLSAEAQAGAVERAAEETREDAPAEEILVALPVLNTLELLPAAREDGTTALTFLWFSPESSLFDQVSLAEGYASRAASPEDGLVGVTGPSPARWQQFEEIDDALWLVEGGTVAVIALVVGVTFRAVGAPLLALFASAIAFVVSSRLLPQVAGALDVSVPEEVEPLVVALTLGIVTDYTVFYLSACRRRLAEGEARVAAAERSATLVAPIVATAGLIVVAGTVALLAGELDFFRAFGPALALTAAVALAVSLTLVPACLAIFGRLVFWPRLRPGEPVADWDTRPSPAREALARFLASPPVAALVALVSVGVLVLAATGLARTELSFRLISGLPADTEERRAAAAAGEGFAPGILAPTVVLVEGQGVAERSEDLAALQEELGRQPGVAAVIGPGSLPGELPGDVFAAEDGGAARFAVVLASDPLGSEAIEDLDALDERLPGLLAAAGLGEAEAAVTGQTAVARDTVEAVVGSSGRVGAVVLAVNFVLLALFLRALVAPLYLLAASLLSVAATLGLTTYVFQDVLGHGDLTYYVPFAAGVLLVSLGSDYNVFVVGRIWQEARERGLREAIAVAGPRASRAISVAGIALALSFAMLAVVPVDGFREFAFMMGAGVLVETFLVRSLLVPALISLFGRTSAWPGRFLRPGEAGTPAEAATTASTRR
ncbi:MAG TPA: MMPL family transporter [Gaiellaceae bacterium]|nr:MMPL family transporter [Gaiellaceae bacterium]